MASALFTRKEVESRNTRNDAVIIIDNVVCDVTRFLLDHPGGIEVLLDNAGKDASKCFHDIGHSEYARDWMQTFAIGEVVPEERRAVLPWPPAEGEEQWQAEQWSVRGLVDTCGAPLVLAVCAALLYTYLF
ncbi:PREDICTED: cytochrome b5-like [Papilio xuthus]|uniref:Cytochrome b5 n=1 Tax=Papilio xuthus TaxID=66420 RepID=A0A194Q5S9_PAPXU|nr:PREDICTED: cytochrome b5-like [Papilio xuthus]KPJ00360.1 Cytochrome b5 [Papilio xuthus]